MGKAAPLKAKAGAVRKPAADKAVRSERDNAAVASALAKVQAAAEGTDNLLPPIVEAVRAYATVGEICNVLRGVFGQYRGVVKF